MDLWTSEPGWTAVASQQVAAENETSRPSTQTPQGGHPGRIRRQLASILLGAAGRLDPTLVLPGPDVVLLASSTSA